MKASDLKVLKVEYLATRRCRLKCDYCKITDTSTFKGPELPLKEVCEMIDLIGWHWPGAPLIIFGGEPTMREDLPEIIAYAKKCGVKTAVISNSMRVTVDAPYRERLVAAGLDNWSVSYDGDDITLGGTDPYLSIKSGAGLAALRMFRDRYGIRDLVACITVTKHNICVLPEIVEMLTKEGIWSICTPLQIGGDAYDYSDGGKDNLPHEGHVHYISMEMKAMAESGKYLMHNEAGWFEAWDANFLTQDWICHDKSVLTVDADGLLRWCVDQPLPQRFSIFDLEVEDHLEGYADLLGDTVPICCGCFWDPAYESIKRGLDLATTDVEGRQSYRHELTPEQVSKLLPEAQQWFKK